MEIEGRKGSLKQGLKRYNRTLKHAYLIMSYQSDSVSAFAPE